MKTTLKMMKRMKRMNSETDSEYDSELCEQEILEALKNDPDLLMRVIELGLAGDQGGSQ